MDTTITLTPDQIRQFRLDNPKKRERDIALELSVPEAALVAADCGHGATRINPDANFFLEHAESLGTVMALSRNESAVHEKIGVYTAITRGRHISMTQGEQIDLRIFPGVWAHGFAVLKKDGEQVRRSLQFFDKHGEAVHKVHLREQSSLEAYNHFVEAARLNDQSRHFEAADSEREDQTGTGNGVDVEALRNKWLGMTDIHQFFGILKKFGIGRRAALHAVGRDLAWQLDLGSVETLFHEAARTALPIMVFVANRGIVQIHTGPVGNIQKMGPWLNVMDDDFHLHLRLDQIAEAWGVRKPTKDGIVTSLEAYDRHGEMIIQFFGRRKEGKAELANWRALVEALPETGSSEAA